VPKQSIPTPSIIFCQQEEENNNELTEVIPFECDFLDPETLEGQACNITVTPLETFETTIRDFDVTLFVRCFWIDFSHKELNPIHSSVPYLFSFSWNETYGNRLVSLFNTSQGVPRPFSEYPFLTFGLGNYYLGIQYSISEILQLNGTVNYTYEFSPIFIQQAAASNTSSHLVVNYTPKTYSITTLEYYISVDWTDLLALLGGAVGLFLGIRETVSSFFKVLYMKKEKALEIIDEELELKQM